MVIIVGFVGILLIATLIFLNLGLSDSNKSKVKSKDLKFDIPVSESTNINQISKFDHYQSLVPENIKDEEIVLNFNENDDENIDSLLKVIEKSYNNVNLKNDFDSQINDDENLNTIDKDTEEALEQDVSNSSIEEDIFNYNPQKDIFKHNDKEDNSNNINQLSTDKMPIQDYNQIEDLDNLLKSLNIKSPESNKEIIEPTISEDNNEISEENNENVAVEVPNEYKSNLDSLVSNSFYGKNNSDEFSYTENNTDEKEFIQAEFYRNTVVRQGDIVEIRLLEDLVIFENYFVPKGTILYGVVAISPRRLFVSLTNNIYKKNSVKKSLLIYDFDGREGIYLKEQGLYKIPADITNELTEIIKSQYSQPSFGGVNNKIEFDKIALISGIDKIYKQINQLTVKVNGGYKLWIKI